MAWRVESFQIAPGATIRHSYSWAGQPKGPQIAFARPNQLLTVSNGVNTIGQGFHVNGGTGYWIDISCEDVHRTGGFGSYDLVGGTMLGLPSA
jgi:hypothetical protein